MVRPKIDIQPTLQKPGIPRELNGITPRIGEFGKTRSHDDRTKANEGVCVTTAVLKITIIIRSDDQVFQASAV
jgi:hypothetical protein